MEPKHIAWAVIGGIVLVGVVGWIVAHNVEKAVENAQQP